MSSTVSAKCRVWIAGAIAAVALMAPALAHADATPQADLALLNQERAALGLPAGITENPQWSSNCAAHNNYERMNGNTLTHQEVPGNPGYTTGGASAGATSILSQGVTWTAFNNPFENGPIHLMQLFAPALAQTGIDDSGGFVCVVTLAGYTRTPPAQETVTTVPGNNSTGFPTSENASESPFVPGDFVGLPQGTTTGREIFVYLNEPGQQGQAKVQITAASLSAGGTPLPVKTVDQTTGNIGPYLQGGIIIPVNPLPQGTQIQASVTIAGPNGPITNNWSFTTAQSPNASLSIDPTGTMVTFSSQSPAPATIRIGDSPDSGAYYVLDQPLTPGTGPIPSQFPLPTGSPLLACETQPATAGFDAQTVCTPPFTIAATGGGGGFGGVVHYLPLKVKRSGQRLSMTLPALALGHALRITETYSGRVCRKGRCRKVSRGSRVVKSTVKATSVSLLVPKRARANRVVVTVSVPAFIRSGKTYAAKPITVAFGI